MARVWVERRTKRLAIWLETSQFFHRRAGPNRLFFLADLMRGRYSSIWAMRPHSPNVSVSARR